MFRFHWILRVFRGWQGNIGPLDDLNRYCSYPRTMQICQKLYESGHITYMRTDSKTYSEDFIKAAEAGILQRFQSRDYVRKDLTKLAVRGNATGNAQEAHEAVRPTDVGKDTLGNTTERDERRLYLGNPGIFLENPRIFLGNPRIS